MVFEKLDSLFMDFFILALFMKFRTHSEFQLFDKENTSSVFSDLSALLDFVPFKFFVFCLTPNFS